MEYSKNRPSIGNKMVFYSKRMRVWLKFSLSEKTKNIFNILSFFWIEYTYAWLLDISGM